MSRTQEKNSPPKKELSPLVISSLQYDDEVYCGQGLPWWPRFSVFILPLGAADSKEIVKPCFQMDGSLSILKLSLLH